VKLGRERSVTPTVSRSVERPGALGAPWHPGHERYASYCSLVWGSGLLSASGDDARMGHRHRAAGRYALVLALAVSALGALASCAVTAAAGGAAAIVRAEQRTDRVRSMKITMSERVDIAGQSSVMRYSGIEQPLSHAARFTYYVSSLEPSARYSTDIVRGSELYIHYAVLSSLHAKDPGIKQWVALNVNTMLGVSLGSLTLLGVQEARNLTGVRVIATETHSGARVTRYAATLGLGALNHVAAVRRMFANLAPGTAPKFVGSEKLEISVGSDGLIHRTTESLVLRTSTGQTVRATISGTMSDFNDQTAAIPVPPRSDVMSLNEFEQLSGRQPSAANTALLQRVVLRAAQVGVGYTRSLIPDGNGLAGQTTLDFCGFGYASESLRSARLQDAYTRTGSSFDASNEVVTYTGSGANEALTEIQRASTACPNGLVSHPPSGMSDLIRHTAVVSDRRLSHGAVAILQTQTAIVKGTRLIENTMAVYQARGDVLSCVYGYGRSVHSVEVATLRAAQQSAENLQRYVQVVSPLAA
jgi:hypothetical protein